MRGRSALGGADAARLRNLRARQSAVRGRLTLIANRPVLRGATGHHAPCPSRAAPANPTEVRSTHPSAYRVVHRGNRTSLTIASRADMVGRIRSHGTSGGAPLEDNRYAALFERAACLVPGGQDDQERANVDYRRLHYIEGHAADQGALRRHRRGNTATRTKAH